MKIMFGNNQGSASIMAIITMTLMGILGAAYVAVSSSEISIATNYRDGVAAQYLAEAGAQWAIIQLDSARGNNIQLIADTATATIRRYQNATQKNSGTTTEGSYEVQINCPDPVGNPNQRQIVSTGTVHNSRRQVIFSVTLAGEGGEPVFRYASFGSSSLTITSGSTITGDIGTNGNATQWGGTVQGNIDYYSGFTGTYSGTGKKNQLASKVSIPVSFPAMPAAPAATTAPIGPVPFIATNYQPGSTALNSSIWSGTYNNMSGTYYVSSGFSGGGFTFNVLPNTVIYANGDINFYSNTKIIGTGNITIVANGSVQINDATISTSNGSINIYAKNQVSLTNASLLSSVTGISIWAGTSLDIGKTSRIVASAGDVNLVANTGSFQNNYDGISANAAVSGNNITIWAANSAALGNSARLLASGGSVNICANGGSFQDNYNGTSADAAVSGNNITIWAATSATLNNNARLLASGGSVNVCANGDSFINNSNTGSNAAISATTIDVWAKNNVQLNGNGAILATGSVNLTANTGSFEANSGSSVSGANITVMAGTTGALNGSTLTATSGVARLYVKTDFALNANSSISGNAIVTAGNDVNLNRGSSPNTVYIAGRNAQVNSGSNSGPVYAAGSLSIYGGTVTYNATTMQALGLAGAGAVFNVGTIRYY